jgi:hypothetical protein
MVGPVVPLIAQVRGQLRLQGRCSTARTSSPGIEPWPVSRGPRPDP